MARRRRSAVLLCTCVALVLLRCSQPVPEPGCIPSSGDVGFVTGGGTGAELVLVAGVPGEVGLEARTSSACVPRWTVEGEVLDSQNRVVPAEFVPAQGVGPILQTRARFTPQLPGSYLVTARFEPAVARAQRVVKVARDRTAEAPIIDALPFDPGVCRQLFRTRGGAVVCQRGATAVVVRSGSVLESFPDTTANVVGNTVWLLTPQRLERRVDTGSGPLALTSSIVAKFQLSASGGFFDDDRAIVLDGSLLRGPLVWDGARLVDEARTFRPGRALLLGSLALSFNGTLVCDTSNAAAGCAEDSPVGVERDVMWSWSQGQTLTFRAGRAPAAPTIFPIGPTAFVDPLEFPVSGSQTPRIRESGQQLYTVTFTPTDGQVLERWPWETRFTRDFGLVSFTADSVSWLKR